MTKQMKDMFEKQSLKYLVQKQMFCKLTGIILDCRTAIAVEIYRGDNMVQTFAVAPGAKDKLPGGEKKLNDMGLTVKYINVKK